MVKKEVSWLDRNEAIVTKIRGLLAIANDGKDDEESQCLCNGSKTNVQV
jgi:hypothetical protein